MQSFQYGDLFNTSIQRVNDVSITGSQIQTDKQKAVFVHVYGYILQVYVCVYVRVY